MQQGRRLSLPPRGLPHRHRLGGTPAVAAHGRHGGVDSLCGQADPDLVASMSLCLGRLPPRRRHPQGQTCLWPSRVGGGGDGGGNARPLPPVNLCQVGGGGVDGASGGDRWSGGYMGAVGVEGCSSRTFLSYMRPPSRCIGARGMRWANPLQAATELVAAMAVVLLLAFL
jgi:hypothetical protein